MADCYSFDFDSLYFEKLHCCSTKSNAKNPVQFTFFAVQKCSFLTILILDLNCLKNDYHIFLFKDQKTQKCTGMRHF